MSDPRYRPRDFCHEPEAFGRGSVLRWKSVEELLIEHPEWDGNRILADARRRAAMMQHQYAVRIRGRLRAQKLKPAGYALTALAAEGENPRPANPADRLNKVLRGAVIMRLEDVAMADVLLQEVSEFDRTRAKQAAGQNVRPR